MKEIGEHANLIKMISFGNIQKITGEDKEMSEHDDKLIKK
jgi:hypothetical protein